MGAEAGLVVAQLALEADRAAEQRGREQTAGAPPSVERSGTLDGDRVAPGRRAIVSIPPAARSSSSSSSSRENGSCSAVACTSTRRPSPVMTTFMSVSAVESSE